MQPSATLDPPHEVQRADTLSPRPGRSGRLKVLVLVLLAWTWRAAIGSLCAMSYLSAIFLVGWLNRLVQGRVVYGWWKQSPRAKEGTFEDFARTFGPDAPVRRPRWFLRESFDRAELRVELERPTPDGDPPGWLRQLCRVVQMPFASLVNNARLGVLTILGTFMLVGWSTLLMTFS